ncbi:tRNA dihydrouridine synthase DusB [bacterium]|nr:tRNA dihydrouridine synthase DusB [bacterium]
MAIKPPRAENPNFTFPSVMLAPVAGVTDRAFRDICRSKGCPLTFSELISARGLLEDSHGTELLTRECVNESPLVIQLFGNNARDIGEATQAATQMGAVGIDLNLGCPAKKVFKKGSGCGLTVFPTELVYVIRAMRQNTDLHLSVKIRGGVNMHSLNYRLIGDIAQGEGCDALIFHARTRAMGFGGQARWDWIADLKDYLDIPVIGNGDVIDALSAKTMIEQTNCDGIMVARAAYGNPWIFREIAHYLKTGEMLPPPSLAEKIETLKEHIRLAVHYRGPRRGCFEMRKHVGWYMKGLRNVRPLRDRINQLESIDEVLNTLDEWLATHDQPLSEYGQTNTHTTIPA